MASDTVFDIPFPCQVNPGLEESRPRSLRWLVQHGLVTTAAERAWHTATDLERLAAYTYPLARGEDQDLTNDFANFFLLYDDQFDYRLGLEPARVVHLARQYAALIDLPALNAPHKTAPLYAALADIWRRWGQGMSAQWLRRTSYHWQQYLMIPAHEAVIRKSGRVPAEDTFMKVRDISGFMYPILDLCERIGGYEVPLAAFHSPQLTVMRHITVQVADFANDVGSVAKERANGEVANLVLVYEHHRGMTQSEAVQAVRKYIHARVARFQELEGEIAGMCAALELAAPERNAVASYVRDLKFWMSGYCQWQRETSRYANCSATPSVPNDRQLM